MTQAVARILEDAARLTEPERAELADRLAETLGETMSQEIEQAQLLEVRRRIAQVESGEVAVIPGEDVMTEARRIATAAFAAT